MFGILSWRIFALLVVGFKFVENAKLSEDIKREIYDPNEFQEEIDPYIPISDFPVDRKKRDVYDYQSSQQYQPQTSYQSSVPVYNHPEVYPIDQDPYRPNEPTFLGKLFFGKIKKVANLIDKKAKFFLKTFPADNVFAEEDPFTGDFYPWSTPSTSYSIHENSAASNKPVEFNRPDVTYTYSTKVGNKVPSSGTSTYSNKPVHSVTHSGSSSSSGAYSKRPVQSITKSSSTSRRRPKQTVSQVSANSISSSYTNRPVQTKLSNSVPSSSSSTYTSKPSSSSYTSNPKVTITKVPNDVSSLSSTNTYSNIPSETVSEVLGTVSSSSSSNIYSSSPVITNSDPISSSSNYNNQAAKSIPQADDTIEILPVKISQPTFIDSPEESTSDILEDSESTILVDQHNSVNSNDGLEFTIEDNDTVAAKKEFGSVLFPENLSEAWEDFAQENTGTLQNIFMEEMINDVFSIKDAETKQKAPKPTGPLQDEGRRYFTQQPVEVDQFDSELVHIMDDVAALVNVVIDDSTPMDSLQKTFTTIKEDFGSFPAVFKNKANELVKVMSDFNSLLEVRQDASFIKDDFMQAMEVIKEDLNDLRKEHMTRGRFFYKSEPLPLSSVSSGTVAFRTTIIPDNLFSSTKNPAHSSVSSGSTGSSSLIELSSSSDVKYSSTGPINVHIIPLNELPKVTDGNSQERYFKKDEILGDKFQQHDSQVLNSSSRIPAESISSQNFVSLEQGLEQGLEQESSGGQLAYLVRDKNNPSRQFLVPASLLQNTHSSLYETYI